jgi:hypothetical protein
METCAPFSLAPHTNEPRDVSQCGALSLLQNPPIRENSAEFAPRLNVKLWVLRDGGLVARFFKTLKND